MHYIYPDYIPETHRVCILVDYFWEKEFAHKRLFNGFEISVVEKLLGRYGISLSECLQVCLSKTEHRDISSPDFVDEFNELVGKVREFNPTLLLCFGSFAHRLGKYGCTSNKDSIFDWRGSLWLSPWCGAKGLSTIHPGHITTGGERPPLEGCYYAYLDYDIKRAKSEMYSAELVLPERRVHILTDYREAANYLANLVNNHNPAAFDIEGGVNGITCFSIAHDPAVAYVIPFSRTNDTPLFSEDEEVELWTLAKQWMEDPKCPKVLQNYMYDAFVLAWTLGIHLRGLRDDTMLKWWEVNPELEKALGVQTSILTKEPFYKADRKNPDDTIAWTYCGKDSCVTLECSQRLEEQLDDLATRQKAKGFSSTCHDHYRLNMAVLEPTLYMVLHGFKWNAGAALDRQAELRRELITLQATINKYSKSPLLNRIAESDYILSAVVATGKFIKHNRSVVVEIPVIKPKRWHIFQVQPDGTTKWVPQKKSFKPPKDARQHEGNYYDYKFTDVVAMKPTRFRVEVLTWEDAIHWAKNPDVVRRVHDLYKENTAEALTEIANILGLSVNVNSPKVLQDYLYKDCEFPMQYVKAGSRNTDKLCTDVGALLQIFRSTKGHEAIVAVLRMRQVLKELSSLVTPHDHDGCIRASLNVVGTDTGRFSSSASPTGRGTLQMQNITKRLRVLFRPTDGTLLQADLAGADSWTVAAHAARLNDRTMMEDILARVKVQSVLALIYTKGASINNLSRPELKAQCADVDENGWLYAACKQVLYGSSYGMGPDTMAEHVMKTSYKKSGTPIYVRAADCKGIQEQAFYVRYPGVKKWQDDWINRLRLGEDTLYTSFGHAHRFWGRRVILNSAYRTVDTAFLNRVLATEPQLVTTYATKLALLRMWRDPDNRRKEEPLRLVCEPLMTVHDSLISQAPDPVWAKAKHAEWFNNPIEVAGMTVTIPHGFESGKDWGMK